MSFGEMIVFGLSMYIALLFVCGWYIPIFGDKLSDRNNLEKYFLASLPIICLIIIVFTLRNLAAFDVVNSMFFIVFYILLGYAWIYGSLWLMFICFDLSWRDDLFKSHGTAAKYTLSGGIIGTTMIFAGANIGDGPGWWCVVFAGGLGLITWLLLGFIINLLTNIFSRITVDRDVSAGLRTGGYLTGSGIILGRASAGDWTSFSRTVEEFAAGWPVLFLALLFISVELYYRKKMKINYSVRTTVGSVVWGIIYIVLGILAVILLPSLNANPNYYWF